MDKRTYYSQKHVVEKYEERRFAGRSGSFVNLKELGIVNDLFADVSGTVLDIPSGTGRGLNFLSQANTALNIVGADYSYNMLRFAKTKSDIKLVNADIFEIPFKANSFSAVLSLRFLFHYPDIENFLKNMQIILKAGGVVIFDICRWSPRQFFPKIFNGNSTGRIYIHKEEKIIALMKKYNFEIVKSKSCFLLPALLYRFLPFFMIRGLDSIEGMVPQRFLTRMFLKIRKIK